jgi:hypothetical protein
MKNYIMALRFDILQSIMIRYTSPKDPPIGNTEKKATENNAKAMNDILCGLSESKFVKVMHCESVKYIWDKLQNIYEGNDKVKKENLQTHRRKFKSLKMKDKENVANYFLRVDEIVNTIRGLSEKVEEPMIMENVLRYIPLIFYAKFYVIE